MPYNHEGQWIEEPGMDWGLLVGWLLVFVFPCAGSAAVIYWLHNLE